MLLGVELSHAAYKDFDPLEQPRVWRKAVLNYVRRFEVD